MRQETMMACTRWNNGGGKSWLNWESSPFFPKGLPFGGLLPSGEDELVGLLLCKPAAELQSLVFWVGATVMDTLSWCTAPFSWTS